MRWRSGLFVVACGLLVAAGAATVGRWQLPDRVLPTGKMISPTGDQTEVGSFPCNMTASPDGRFVLVTNSGYREQVSVLDATTGKLVSHVDFNGGGRRSKESLYFGIAATPAADGTATVAVSRGSEDKVSLYSLSTAGALTFQADIGLPKTDNPLELPNHVAGLAWSADGAKLYAVANQSHAYNDFKGSVFTLDPVVHSVIGSVKVGSFPLDIAVGADGAIYVANEGDRGITRLGSSGDSTAIPTGEQPSYLTFDHSKKRLFVSNSNSDTVSFVDVASGKVTNTVLVRPSKLKGYPGATPLGLALSPDDKTLYVAIGDLNAVGVIDVAGGKLLGYLPVGWYPTSVAVSADGSKLFVANAKGVKNSNPNGAKIRTWGQYDENIIEGTVSTISLPLDKRALQDGTADVLVNNHAAPVSDQVQVPFVNPGIQHVIYIIKENRTYDQVFGDLKQANSDASLVMFGRDVTPNMHALAERFGVYDNFYVCAEVSADGWNWSTSGLANEYTERNVPYNYSGRGRSYDFEGTNNDTPVSLKGIRDVAAAPGGYVWDAFLKKGLSVRDYGMFNASARANVKGPDGQPLAIENHPTQPNLVDRTCVDFRDFDTAFPDSQAWIKAGIQPAPRQMKSYGSHQDPCRITTWLREFNEDVTNKNFPSLSMLRLMRDHTAGTSPGASSPRAMVADNDYSVGQVVEAVSHSPYWKSTAIFVVEDDAQSGFDHIDCHRSPVLVISPYTRKGVVNSQFFNTDSVLATMEKLFNLPPHNEYLAVAPVFTVFHADANNDDIYDAIMPDKKILGEVNEEDAYRAADSARLFKRTSEESEPDFELNEILWHSIKGVTTPLPQTPGVIWGLDKDDDG